MRVCRISGASSETNAGRSKPLTWNSSRACSVAGCLRARTPAGTAQEAYDLLTCYQILRIAITGAIEAAGAVGYLLKDRVFNDDRFADAIRTVAAGRTVMAPEVVAKLMGRRARDEPITRLTAREREVLKLMAEGRSNSAIAQRLFISEKAVGKHSTSIFTKLDLAPSTDDNRRVLAVLAFLNS